MIFLQLFITFLKIGIFTFGGGYAMISLIQNEVVIEHQWMTAQEFTDMLAVSQMTPGPIGINTATYAGYTAVLNAGYPTEFAILGALLASISVVMLPIALMLVVTRFFIKNRNNKDVDIILKTLRITAIGLIAAAALSLFNTNSFGNPGMGKQFIISIAIFGGVFLTSLIPQKGIQAKRIKVAKPSPILLIIISGLIGLIVYSF